MTTTETGVLLRPATSGDLERIRQLIREAHLPDVQVEEFLEGFLVAERDGEVVGCGAIEHYGEAALLRSVVVDPSQRGTGLGRRLAAHLEERAGALGAREFYLFSIDAWRFWEHLGYEDLALTDWAAPVRRSWQYRYVTEHEEQFRRMGLHAMRRPAADDPGASTA